MRAGASRGGDGGAGAGARGATAGVRVAVFGALRRNCAMVACGQMVATDRCVVNGDVLACDCAACALRYRGRRGGAR